MSRLGFKEGAHIIAAQFHRGGKVIAPELTPEQRRNYYAAESPSWLADHPGLCLNLLHLGPFLTSIRSRRQSAHIDLTA